MLVNVYASMQEVTSITSKVCVIHLQYWYFCNLSRIIDHKISINFPFQWSMSRYRILYYTKNFSSIIHLTSTQYSSIISMDHDEAAKSYPQAPKYRQNIPGSQRYCSFSSFCGYNGQSPQNLSLKCFTYLIQPFLPQNMETVLSCTQYYSLHKFTLFASLPSVFPFLPLSSFFLFPSTTINGLTLFL